MPRVPKTFDAKFDGIQVLNAIRNAASTTYQERIPVATQNNITAIGNAMMQYEATQNEFLNQLVNRIARVMITSKSYQNQLRPFKRGTMEMGETIEEVFVNMATAHPFDPLAQIGAGEVPMEIDLRRAEDEGKDWMDEGVSHPSMEALKSIANEINNGTACSTSRDTSFLGTPSCKPSACASCTANCPSRKK